jgi:DHA1 family bicyclomycin/chloramphenicol resistance-like MFS transporter
VAASIGGLIARQFDGTATPIVVGQLAVSAMALATIFVTERGRLMQAGRAAHD